MNERVVILIGAWIAMGFALHFGHPAGYLVIIIGLAASVAIASEDLREEPEQGRSEESETPAVQPAQTSVPAFTAKHRVRKQRAAVPTLGDGPQVAV